MIIFIETNRYVIKQLERAIEKYNTEKPKHFPRVDDYSDIIDKVIMKYIKDFEG